jgi:replicative DNA helicase
MQAELAEKALLGACIINNKAPLIASDFVDATDFYLPKHQVIFAAILSLVGRGADADPVSVCSEIGPDAERAYVFSLPQLCPSASNVKVYAQAVRDAALDRRVRKAIENASQHRGNKLLSQLQEQLYQLDKRVERSVTMAEVWTRMRDNINVPLAPGCEYPWRKVQWLTRGMRPGWLCILAGEPSHGKTAGALEVTERAIRQGRSVAFLSLEMNEEAIALRLAQRYGMSSDRYYESKLNDHDESIIGGLSEESHWRNLHLEKVERAAQIGIVFRRWKPDLVVVDHLQLLAGSEDVKELSKTTRTLKLMAERFDTPILCLSQLSRAHGEEQNRLPKLTRLRGSGTIEQDSDTVVFVWRKRDELETLLSESALVVAKSRMGKLGAVRTSFDGDSQTFRPITQDYA